MNISIQPPTIAVTGHIGLMYMVIEGNYELATNEILKYYLGLACITYAVEFCTITRQTLRYSVEYIHIDNYILLPLFILPLIVATCYIWGFTIMNIFSTARVLSCLISFIILYCYNRNPDRKYIIPILINYLPLCTIFLHIIVVCSTAFLVKYNNRNL